MVLFLDVVKPMFLIIRPIDPIRPRHRTGLQTGHRLMARYSSANFSGAISHMPYRGLLTDLLPI